MTDFEAALRELIFRLRDADARIKKAEDDAGALDQMVKLISPGLGFGAAAAVTHPATVTGCGTVNLTDTLPLVDTEMGSCTLAYDGVSAWTGCNPGATRTGGIVFALHYKYTNTGALTCSYAGSGGTLIPTAGTTCGTTTNINAIAYSGAGVVCSPFQQTFHNGGSLAMNTLYATSGNTFTVKVG